MTHNESNILLNLYISVFVSSIFVGFILFLIPVFAQQLGASYIEMGFVGASRSIPFIILAVFVGGLTNKFNRANFYTITLLINALPSALLMFTTEVYQLIILQVFQGICFALIIPISDVLVADLATSEGRVKAMGRYSVSIQSGNLIGALIGGIIAQVAGFRLLWFISSTLMVISAIFSYAVISRGYVPHKKVTGKKVKIRELPIRKVLPIYLTILPYGMILGVLFSIFPGYQANLGFTPSEIGLVIALMATARIMASINIERTMVFGVNKAIGGSGLMLAASMIFISYQREIIGISFGSFMIGLSIAIILPVSLAAIAQHIAKEDVGIGVGILSTTMAFGLMTGPIIGGFVSELWTPSSVYLVFGFVALIMIPLGLLWKKYELETNF